MNILEDLFKEEFKLINKLSKCSFELGVISDSKNRKENEVTNADLLFIHEFGSPLLNIPKRPILEWTFEQSDKLLSKAYKDCLRVIYTNKDWAEVIKILEKTALRIESIARKGIMDGKTNLVRLKTSTIKAKGSDLPLFDTGQLARSIKCRLKIVE